MNELMQQLQTLVGGNAMLATLTSGSVIVWLVANIKNIFNTVVNAVVTLVSFEVVNTYEDARSIGHHTKARQMVFNELITKSRNLWERSVNLDLNDVDERQRWNGNTFITVEDPCSDILKTNLTYGFSIRIMNGKIVTCTRTINTNNQKTTISVYLRVFFSSKRKFTKWLESEIENRCNEIEEKISRKNTVSIGYGEAFYSEKIKRTMDSIFTNGDVHVKLFNDIKKFIDNRKIYEKLSYPYKYSAILEGVPGSGKSSTILAIASELGRRIEYINLSTTTMKELLNKMNTDTKDTIYVFEDVDAINDSSFSNRNEKSKNGSVQEIGIRNNNDGKLKVNLFSVSLSDLLNITDGLLSSDGAICLFTTNHINSLDPALLRQGRMNGIFTFEYMNSETSDRMVRHYLGHSIGKMKEGIKPAELQESLLNIMVGKETEESLEKFKMV